MTDPALMPAHILAREIASRRLSPVDAVDACLARIEACDGRLRAYAHVYAADARLAAEGADKAIRSGHAVGPMHGVPVALKDLLDMEGRITMGGSAANRQRRSSVTATVARRLMAQGLIILGKTHTVEFAYGGWGTNQHLGTPWNPWDLGTHRVPGGSSSGSGVAVATGMAPWAIGTDTGGSVRLPASFCGITALKPTVGRVSTFGVIPLSSTLDTVGPMARTVRDAALLYNLISGQDPLDRSTRGIDPVDPLPPLERGVRGLRLGRMPDAERRDVAGEVLEAYDRSLNVLADLGAEIVDVALPFLFGDIMQSRAITQAEAFKFHGELARDHNALLGDDIRKRLLEGADISAHDYLAARELQRSYRRSFDQSMRGIDAILTPTTETPAPPVEGLDPAALPSRFTRPANFLELCALALPNGFSAGGLPLSLQIVCRGYDEALALRIGQAYESATGWHRRFPTVP